VTITYVTQRGAAVAAFLARTIARHLQTVSRGTVAYVTITYVPLGGSPRDGSIRDDHVRPPTWRCRSCFGEMILARTIARHLRTYILQTNQLILVAPQTPFPELGLQPSDARRICMSFAGKTQVKYKRTYSYGRHVVFTRTNVSGFSLRIIYPACRSSPGDGSIRDDYVLPPTWRCRSCLLARTIARHLQTGSRGMVAYVTITYVPLGGAAL